MCMKIYSMNFYIYTKNTQSNNSRMQTLQVPWGSIDTYNCILVFNSFIYRGLYGILISHSMQYMRSGNIRHLLGKSPKKGYILLLFDCVIFVFIFACIYIFSYTFAYCLNFAIYFPDFHNTKLIVNKRGAPEASPTHYRVNFISTKIKKVCKKTIINTNNMKNAKGPIFFWHSLFWPPHF